VDNKEPERAWDFKRISRAFRLFLFKSLVLSKTKNINGRQTMENPLEIVNTVGDAATGVVKGLGTGVTGIAGKINGDITNILDKPPIVGKYGPHKAIDRLVKGTLSSINAVGNGVVGGIQDQGHTIVNTVETPIDQLTGGMKRR
jgi:hypothetical protein